MKKPSLLESRWLFPLVVAITGFLLYANTIPNDYALDDGAVITSNPYVQQGLKGLPGIFTSDIWHFEGTELGYYRPLSLVTFAIENQFFGNNPHVSHLVNAMLYALTGLVLCLLLFQVFSNYAQIFSFVIALLFMAHPIHTEVVANVKSRDEILSFLNLLLAIYFLLLSTGGNWKWLASACFFYYLALLSKETAMAGIILAPAILYFSSTQKALQILKRTAPFILVLLIFLWQRHLALGGAPAPEAGDIVSFPYADSEAKLATMFTHLYRYVKLVLIPYPLSYNYAYNEIPVADWSSVPTILGIGLAAVVSFFSFYHFNKKTPPQLGVSIFALLLAPALGFVLLKGGILAERFLYAPTLGFCILLTWGIFKLMKITVERRAGQAEIPWMKFLPFAVILVCYSFTTMSRNADWKNDLTISGHDAKVTPNSCQVHLHYGKKLVDLGVAENDAARKQEYFSTGTGELRKAININPHYARAYFKLAYAYQALEPNPDTAIYYYIRAIDEAPGYALAYNNLGALYSKLGRVQLAAHYLQRALEINPNLPDAQHNLQQLQQTPIPASPENADSTSFEYYSAAGIKYAREKDFTAALKYLSKAVELNPTSVPALVNLAACYGMMQNYKKSEEVLMKAQGLEPDNKSVTQNLFTLYHIMGNTAKEKEYKEKLASMKK